MPRLSCTTKAVKTAKDSFLRSSVTGLEAAVLMRISDRWLTGYREVEISSITCDFSGNWGGCFSQVKSHPQELPLEAS
jgi:hypothetical protein